MPLDRRVQLLIDERRYARLEREAQERGESVAAVIRTALDRLFSDELSDRRRAADELLAMDPMPVDDWPAMKRDLESMWE